MQCRDINNYIELIENTSNEKLLGEIYIHAQKCESCSKKLELEFKIKSKLIAHYNSINPSSKLKNKIKQPTNRQPFKIQLRPTLIAASLVILLGLGIFTQKTILGLPQIYELHNLTSFHILSTNIDDLTNHLGIVLNKVHLIQFDKAGYIPHGAIKLSKPFKRDIKLIAFKHENGNKISICFLPRSYNLPYHVRTQIKNTNVHHGKSNSDNFIFWQGDKNTIVLVGDNMSHEKLIDLAYNLIGEV